MTLRHRSLRPRPLRAVSLIAAALLVGRVAWPAARPTTTTRTQPSASASPTVGSTDYLPVPDGVELTPQGSDLALGEPAVVAWQPAADKVGVLELTVTRIEKVDMDRLSSLGPGQADPQPRRRTSCTRRSHNIGRTNLGRAPIPLYLADGERHAGPCLDLREPLPCPAPARRAAGEVQGRVNGPRCARSTCSPKGGDFAGVSFYTGPGFDPITWTGQVSRPKPEQPDKKKSDDQQGNG